MASPDHRNYLRLLGAAAVAASVGCQSPECTRCPDFSTAAIPAPPGNYVCRWIGLQKERADEIDFVIHQHEWYQDGEELGPRGQQHINVLASRLPQCANLVVVEPYEVRIRAGEKLDAAVQRGRDLDQIRKERIVRALLEAGVLDAEERVVIDYPRDEGLRGAEAPRAYRQIMRSGNRGGGIMGAGPGNSGFGGGSGSFGGANSGGIF